MRPRTLHMYVRRRNIKKALQYQRLTESPSPKQSIGIFQGRGFPPWILEIVRQEPLCGPLLPVSVRHAPESLEDILLSECQVEQRAINGVLLVCLCILISCYDLELRSLRTVSNGAGSERRDWYSQ